jgi:hypothetical protein
MPQPAVSTHGGAQGKGDLSARPAVVSPKLQVTGSRRYLAAAVSAGELVWERGLLTKGGARMPQLWRS